MARRVDGGERAVARNDRFAVGDGRIAVAVLAQRLHVQEDVLGAAVDVDEAEPLDPVEPLHPRRLERPGLGPRQHDGDRALGGGGGHYVEDLNRLAAALGDLHPEHDLGALGDGSVAKGPQHIAVQENVAFAVRTHDEAVALRRVEPFHVTTDNHVAELSRPHGRVEAPSN